MLRSNHASDSGNSEADVDASQSLANGDLFFFTHHNNGSSEDDELQWAAGWLHSAALPNGDKNEHLGIQQSVEPSNSLDADWEYAGGIADDAVLASQLDDWFFA
ncbi:hypothetical protein IWQ55_004054 [Labrenzia sp. EL_208]|nr:hypothetical protein [Labrenzia sp. EL_132]MBG6230830.1 hypothetical protein [Labrenzia sp. EL_208]